MTVRLLLLWMLCGAFVATPAFAQDDPEDGTSEVDSEAPEEESEGETEPDKAEEASRYSRELQTVEEDVNHLKERVFRSKATLQLLKELVIEGATVGSRVIVWHVNKMGGAYTMESIQYFLDGKNVFTKVDPGGSLDKQAEIKVHERTVPPGNHNVQVHMVLRGSGYGIFSYLRTYQFKVQSSYSFKVEDGKVTIVRVIANERGGLRKSFVDRPGVQYEERVGTLREE
jgi:hypothetical protein